MLIVLGDKKLFEEYGQQKPGEGNASNNPDSGDHNQSRLQASHRRSIQSIAEAA